MSHSSSTQGGSDDRLSDQAEEGEKHEEQGPPKPVGFWHKDLSHVRKSVIIQWARTVLIICVAILSILSLYWAVLFKVLDNMSALNVAVVSFDDAPRPLVGQAVIQATEMQARSSMPHLGFVTRSPSDYNNDPMAVRQDVYDEHVWAAIIVNRNATSLLQAAVETGNATYDPLGAAQIVYVQARDETTYANYITPMLNQIQVQITSKFGQEWATAVLSNTSLDPATYSRSPQALNPAIGFSTFNLRPFTPPAATPSVTIGLIYLIIIAFFSFTFFLPIHTKYIDPQGHPPLHFYQLIIWRYLVTLIAYFFMSLSYSLVSLAFQIPFSHPRATSDVLPTNTNANAFGRGTFPVYWMLNFVGMAALGLACENVAMVIGQPWTALWLIFWVITNVSTSFYAIPLAPRFFYWGWAWPLQQIVTASRTLLFDVHSRLGLNFGILFAWCAVNTALFPLCCLFMRFMTVRGKAKEKGEPSPKLKDLLH